jgi:predicted component of type VI protein secretion system
MAQYAGAGYGWAGGNIATEVATPVAGKLAWLIEASGPRAGQQHRLGTQVTIGRDSTCADLVINDSKVSNTHTRVRFEQDKYVIYDLGSTNKTFVNGQPVTTQALKDGDQIGLGPNVLLIFKIV